MRPLAPLRKLKLGWVFAGFGAAVAAHAWHYVASVLAIPDIAEVYARTWHFQLVMFSIFRLPFWLLALALVIELRRVGAAEPKRQ